jgi:hypothetical protein
LDLATEMSPMYSVKLEDECLFLKVMVVA